MTQNKRQFPILFGYNYEQLNCPKSIDWDIIAPYENQALKNHGGQTLQRLAERGGLDPKELFFVLNNRSCRDWNLVSNQDAVNFILDFINKNKLKTLDEWNESDGDVLWWKFPVNESPYCGSPLDTEFPDYLTHWTKFVVPNNPFEND